MADLLTELSGKTLYYHDMEPIVIDAESFEPIRIELSSDSRGVIIDETYYPDFSGCLELDLRDVMASDMYLEIPNCDSDIIQTNIYRRYSIAIDGGNPVSFTVCGFTEDAKSRITDIDTLRIPKNYLLPLSVINDRDRAGIRYIFNDEVVEDSGKLTSEDSIGITARMIDISHSPAVGKGPFCIEMDADNASLTTAVFRIVPGTFEQYLFANRYGGFDNIPMDGVREFAPELSFETGKYSSGNEQVSASADYIYSQNSGYQSHNVLELASELLCSPQIYHLSEDGQWRRIIILESNLQSSSTDDLHSFTFKYKYADDTRPGALKYRSQSRVSTSSVAKVSTYTFLQSYASDTWIIKHNLGRYPSVSIVDSAGTAVFGSITYDSANQITIRFAVPFSGKAYLN